MSPPYRLLERGRIQVPIDVIDGKAELAKFASAAFDVAIFDIVCVPIMCACVGERHKLGVAFVAAHVKILHHVAHVLQVFGRFLLATVHLLLVVMHAAL